MCPYGLMGNRIPATVGAHLHDFSAILYTRATCVVCAAVI